MRKTNTIKSVLTSTIAVAFAVPALAANDLQIGTLLSSVYSILFPIGIVFGVIFIVIAGFKMMMSEGNPQKLEDAKEDLYSAIVGTLFIGLALVLVRIIIKATLSIEI
jgi:hypothetical protein